MHWWKNWEWVAELVKLTELVALEEPVGMKESWQILVFLHYIALVTMGHRGDNGTDRTI